MQRRAAAYALAHFGKAYTAPLEKAFQPKITSPQLKGRGISIKIETINP